MFSPEKRSNRSANKPFFVRSFKKNLSSDIYSRQKINGNFEFLTFLAIAHLNLTLYY